MNAPATCPKCGAVVPADAPAGLCPYCLLAAGPATASSDELPPTQDHSDGPEQGKQDAEPPEIMEQPGSLIAGRYKLLERIGEGGMGTVWMAEQRHPVRRLVALKVIKAGLDSGQVVARFEAERQALALMDHPNIARVFDAGTTEGGRPFFVMELVKGMPITEYCDTHRLTIRQRLELFVQVCQAVQHAHQKGIIHRDLKPSNIVVAPFDGRPVVKVIDFGVAKATGGKLTDKTMYTAFGAVVGTIQYMSPEQAELNNQDIDTRSDVYALGVVLYELLTGSTPLASERVRGSAMVALLLAIKEEEPERPSTRLSHSGEAAATVAAQRRMEVGKLAAVLRRELDWIVLKALEKDRARRYGTASELAQDVERYLRGEAVVACPPSLGYRLGKWAGKHRGVLAATAAVVPLLLLGTVVSTWQAVRATRAEQQANDEAAQAAAARDRADAERQRAEEQLRRTEWSDYANKLALAQAAFNANNLADAFRYLDECPVELRGWEHGHLCWLFDGSKQTLYGHTGGVSSVAFSPDGRRLFTWDGRGEMRAWSAEDGKPVPADNPPPRPNSGFAALSPDGRLFALRGYLTLQDVRIINRLRAAPLWPLPDAAERKHYHSEQARLAEQQQQWFAAAFHLGRLLLDEPNNAEWQQRRQQALKKHAAAQPKPAPGKTPPPDKDH